MNPVPRIPSPRSVCGHVGRSLDGGHPALIDERHANARKAAAEVLDGHKSTTTLTMNPGALVLFRGRNSMHRVTPTVGNITRMLAVLAYNTQPGIALSESARMTFFGRLD